MERNGLFYGRSMIRFSLKNATKELSPIRLRINLNGERMTFYLPQDYKICPKHWDKEVGGAIEDSKNYQCPDYRIGRIKATQHLPNC